MEQICKNCQYWIPKFYQNGICQQEGMPNSRLYIINGTADARLVTSALFSCQVFKKREDPAKDMI